MQKLVYVSDDYDHLAELIAEFLRRATTWEAVPMKDGAEVLAEAARRRPDVCILDIDMPRIGGVQAAMELLRMFPENPPMLIGMSGVVPVATLAHTKIFAHVFKKPLDAARLIETLEGSGPV